MVHASAARQAVLDGRNESAGQTPLDPVHVSATSQVPADGRQIVAAAANVHAVVQQPPAVPLSGPASHASPGSTTPSPHVSIGKTCTRSRAPTTRARSATASDRPK